MNIQKFRDDTKGLDHSIFLNSAGSSLPPQIVNEKVITYLMEEAREGGYRQAELWQSEIQEFYHQTANLLKARPENIAFSGNATEAYSKALSSIPFGQGDYILTTEDDYVSNHLHFISMKKRFGIRVLRARTLENGDLDLNHVKSLIDKYSPKVVSVTHIPTNSGLVQDIVAVGQLCRDAGCLYLVDACQSAGQLPLDVSEIQCDFLSATGRKFLRGPRGTGFLYVSDRMLEGNYAPLFIDLQGATWTGTESYETVASARRFEWWEMPYALLLGLKEAVKYANETGLKAISDRNHSLSNRLRSGLDGVSGIRQFDQGSLKGSIITFRKEGVALSGHHRVLEANNVRYSVSTGSGALIDFHKKGVNEVIRLSPHYFNTVEEMDQVVDIIREIR